LVKRFSAGKAQAAKRRIAQHIQDTLKPALHSETHQLLLLAILRSIDFLTHRSVFFWGSQFA
jgi:hypothetical protein